MNEKVRSNAVVTATWDEAILTLAVRGAGSVMFDLDKAPPWLVERAARHGFEQRLRDRAAIGRDDKTGASASPQAKFERIKELADHYAAGGDWELHSTGGTRRKEVDYIMQALANVQGLELDEMTERVTAVAAKRKITVDAYLKRVAVSPAVAQAIAALKYGASEGGDAYMDELNDEE